MRTSTRVDEIVFTTLDPAPYASHQHLTEFLSRWYVPVTVLCAHPQSRLYKLNLHRLNIRARPATGSFKPHCSCTPTWNAHTFSHRQARKHTHRHTTTHTHTHTLSLSLSLFHTHTILQRSCRDPECSSKTPLTHA